jgi:hypothetical protein
MWRVGFTLTGNFHFGKGKRKLVGAVVVVLAALFVEVGVLFSFLNLLIELANEVLLHEEQFLHDF